MGANCWKAALIVGALVSFVVTIAFNTVTGIPGFSPFNTSIANMSERYMTGITPSALTFGIWGLIYAWQFTLILYCLTLLCRNSDNVPLYVSPAFIPSVFFASYIINYVGNNGWLVVFLEGQNVAALVCLLLGLLSLGVCLLTSCAQLEASGAEMVKKGLSADIWCTRIIVQNGIALYLAWSMLATAIGAVVVSHYVAGVSMDTSCFGALIVVNILIVGWFILETFVFDRQLRYVFTHYITYIIAFVGVYTKNYNPDVPYSVYEVVLLALVSLLALVKLIVIVVRSIKDPIHYPTKDDKEPLIPEDLEPIKHVQY